MTLSLLQDQKHHKEEGKHLVEQLTDSNQNPPASTEVYSLLHSRKTQKDMNTKKHELWDEDKKLFESMKGHYQFVNEENFFKNMQFKQEYECTSLNDLIVSEYENEDEIYIVREHNEEYVVGHGIGTEKVWFTHQSLLSGCKTPIRL